MSEQCKLSFFVQRLISGHFSLTDFKSETWKKHESSVTMEVDQEEDIEKQQEQETRRKLQRLTSDTEMSKNWNTNPSSRIIRVSKATGGKDRHSKVLTTKGLRDRRIRLSVTTAIQFYDLQDRLGFDQPSKAIEWLLNAASDSISDLPPLSFNDQTQHIQTKSSSRTSESSLLSLSRTEKAKEHKDKDPSFTQLLTGGFNNRNHHWTGSDCYNPVQEASLSPFSYVVPEYNFGSSSSDYSSRGTLQSNSQSLFGNNQRSSSSSSSPMDSQSISFFMATPPVLDQHSHQVPASFDGRLYLYHRSSDEKRKA